MNNFLEIKKNYLMVEEHFSDIATKNAEAIRLNKNSDDFRSSYYRDIDKIIHSLSYTRYADKTQVYSFKENDHISKRIIHVQLVSKIARTICRALRLNEDLGEAIALGHDIGHTPLGHTGEAILNEISIRELGEYFSHNIQSVRYYMDVDNNGNGLNLTIQTLDGIMCHNGEMLSNCYKPVKKDKKEFLLEYDNAYKDIKTSSLNHPMTIEGCVVRISDIIAYIGRDIEDAINLGLFDRSELPKEITSILGDNNKDIINTLVLDIIDNSLGKDYIEMSSEVYKALLSLKKFNYKNIYEKSMSDEDKTYYKRGMNKLFEVYLDMVVNNRCDNLIFKIFLDKMNSKYMENTSSKRKVIDFIAGMTDDMFLQEVRKYL